MTADPYPSSSTSGQLHGEFAVAPIARGKARWDQARSLTVFHDEPPRLGPYPRPGTDRVNATDVLVHLLTAPGCPSLEDCDWAHISGTALAVPSVQIRVHTREALELWAGHFGLDDGSEQPLSSGKLEVRRWGKRTVGGRTVDIKVTGTMEKAS